MRVVIFLLACLSLSNVVSEDSGARLDISAIQDVIDRIHQRRASRRQPVKAEQFRIIVKQLGLKREELIQALVANLERHSGHSESHRTICFFGAMNRLVQMRAVEAADVIKRYTRASSLPVRNAAIQAYVQIEPPDLREFALGIIRNTAEENRWQRRELYWWLSKVGDPIFGRRDRELVRKGAFLAEDYSDLLKLAVGIEPNEKNLRFLNSLLNSKNPDHSQAPRK